MVDSKAKGTDPLVVSSLTGKPLQISNGGAAALPKRAKEDQDTDLRDAESNAERLLREVPPHWGK